MAVVPQKGDQGDPGEPGPPGEPGAPGSAYEPLEIVQPVMQTEWVLVHNLGRHPAVVTVYDTSNTEYEGNEEIVDQNTLKITFSVPISGRAVLV